MNMSIVDKLGVILKYIGSSFIPMGLFLLFVLWLTLLILNVKYKNKVFNVVILGIYIGTLLGIVLSHSDYVLFSIKSTIKLIMNYIYFPSPVIYFFIVLFVLIINILTMFNDKISIVKKIFNYVVATFIYFLFFLFIVRVTMNGILLMDIVNVYNDEVILSLVQISNLIFVIWIVVTCFYKLYLFYKKKFD